VTPTVAIVGAGITGLSCAGALAGDARAVVLDRVPVPGGVHGWDTPQTRQAVEAARLAGAVLHLGETAIRWDGRTLVSVGQDGVRSTPAVALVIAAGSRPLGRAELGLAGPRPAGILAATVACHLSETGVLIGRRPAVIGGGDWASRAVQRLFEAGAEAIELIAPGGVLRAIPDSPRLTVRSGAAVAVEGGARVTAVRVEGGERIECDALVLAHSLAPLRNVDGAVWSGLRTVYAQPSGDPLTAGAAADAGARAAAEVLHAIRAAA
jgi:hypothetical protein